MTMIVQSTGPILVNWIFTIVMWVVRNFMMLSFIQPYKYISLTIDDYEQLCGNCNLPSVFHIQ